MLKITLVMMGNIIDCNSITLQSPVVIFLLCSGRCPSLPTPGSSPTRWTGSRAGSPTTPQEGSSSPLLASSVSSTAQSVSAPSVPPALGPCQAWQVGQPCQRNKSGTSSTPTGHGRRWGVLSSDWSSLIGPDSRDTVLSLVENYYTGAKVYAITTHLNACTERS